VNVNLHNGVDMRKGIAKVRGQRDACLICYITDGKPGGKQRKQT